MISAISLENRSEQSLQLDLISKDTDVQEQVLGVTSPISLSMTRLATAVKPPTKPYWYFGWKGLRGFASTDGDGQDQTAPAAQASS